MAGLKSSVAPRIRTRTELEVQKVVDDDRKIGKNENFAAESSELMAKKRKGGTFMEENSKRATFYKENSATVSESNGKLFVISDSSSDDNDASEESDESSSEMESEDDSSDSDGVFSPSKKAAHSPAAEDSSAAEPTDSESEESSVESSETEERWESEEALESEKEQGPETHVLIDLSSGDEDPLPLEKTYIWPVSSRTRSKQPDQTSGWQETESRRESSVSNQQKKMKKGRQPRNLQRRMPHSAVEKTSRRDGSESSKKMKAKAGGPRKNLKRERSDSVTEDVHNSYMLSSTRRSSEEEVRRQVVSDSGEEMDGCSGVSLKNDNNEIMEARKRKERLRTAVKTGRGFCRFLTNSIWQEEDEIFNLLQPEPGEVMEVLPRKFNYRAEVKKDKKTEEEKDMDALWAEMELGLMNDRIGSHAFQDSDEEDVVEPGICPKGKHRFALNEEIGMICFVCSYVETEIPSVFPSMEKVARPSKSRYKDDYRRSFDDLDINGDDDSEEGSSNLDEEQFTPRGTVWDLVPRTISSSLFPHQKEGFEFMWKNVGGSIDLKELKGNSAEQDGGGCIISHAPGTGKTRLTLVFLKAYTELFPKSRPIVIAPASMLLTWEEEFEKCKIDIPFHNLNNDDFSMKEKHEILKLVEGNSHLKNKNLTRMVKLYSWSKTTSVLGISYPLFVKLADSPITSKILLEMPEVVVLDEGHTPRNDGSSMWNTLCKLKSKRRIILSGTPFQNNCNELCNTLKLVRPRDEKLVSAKLDNLRRSLKDDGGQKAAILKAAVAPFAHVYKGSILQKDLPGLRNCAVVLNPTEYQAKILRALQDCSITCTNTLEFEHKQAFVTIHPSLVLNCKLLKKEEHEVESEKERLSSCRGDPQEGAKTRFLVKFVGLCMAVKEKVLVFGQYKEPLKLIMEHLCAAFHWSDGEEVLIMTGDIEQRQRQSMIGRFNDPDSKAVVLLASIKACCEGINLVGASRVVLLDVVWNPSVERQAISRAYRLGQKKVVYTYHLMMKGSNEGDRYIKQARKQRLSEFMFSNSCSSSNPPSPPSSSSSSSSSSTLSSEDILLEMMTSHVELKDLFHEVIFQPRENNLMEKFGLVD